jgi:EAL domain-containing protein (putative c-di-GMP-specific phosphodiesterase class I)
VASRLSAHAGPSDFVARFGGNEFVVLLDNPAKGPALLAEADGWRKIMAEPIDVGGHLITRTASVGVSAGDPETVTVTDSLDHANAAMQLAKSQGRDRAMVFDDAMRGAARQRTVTEMLLRHAIDHGGLELHYQPEIDIVTGELLAVEALVRWRHPSRGLLAAGEFIGIAETSGLIVDLGQWVMDEACRQMAEWRTTYPGLSLHMRVNMSPAQLASGNIVELVAGILEKHGVPGRVMCFEITEHAVMQDVRHAVEALHELKSLGVSLAIDDFGTGFSSMSYLKQLPVDILKIDQTFVRGLGVDGGDRAIVGATVGLAKAFGLEVVAEGVETPDLLDELLELGCHRAQGYLLSRPKPPADLAPYLAAGRIDPNVYRAEPEPEVTVEMIPDCVGSLWPPRTRPRTRDLAGAPGEGPRQARPSRLDAPAGSSVTAC